MTSATKPGEKPIQRYDLIEHGSYYSEGSIDPVPDGGYVRYDDHIAAMSRPHALSDGDIEKIRSALEHGRKLAQAQHVAKTYDLCEEALALLPAASGGGKGQ